MRTGKTGRVIFLATCAWTVLAVAGRLPHLGWISPLGVAMAQETGHDGGTGGPGSGSHGDGDSDDGTGHDTDHDSDGGHTGGPGGQGGHGGHGGAGEIPAALAEVTGDGMATSAAVVATERTTAEVRRTGRGKFRDADFFRFELGAASPAANDAYWLPSGYPSDPKVSFSLNMNRGAFGSLAVGHYWQQGVRSEIALSGFGTTSFTSPPGTTSPPTATTHAAVSGNTNSVALMANGYYTPYIKALGQVQPYVSAGLGISANTMGTWTRTNPTVSPAVRSYDGNTTLSLAGSIGVGVEIYLGEASGKPTSLDLGYRYFDLGKVAGSANPSAGGGGSPVAPLTFNKTEQVVSLSLRVWF